jgi:5-oxoprolinase (ATP-hydrolysing) subunit A
MSFDINCDLGEREPLNRTIALMRSITSANVACGGHAGDFRSMRRCVRLAKKHHVRLGAHPGMATRGDFGRAPITIEPDELKLALLHQVGSLDLIANSEGVKLHHIKLHGGLYHATERDRKLARTYLEAVRHWWPKVVVYALAGGTVASLARQARVEVWPEAFLDRGYRDDGSLVPRGDPAALLNRRADFLRRIQLLIERRAVATPNGRVLRLEPRTLSIHSDTPNAGRLARLARTLLKIS